MADELLQALVAGRVLGPEETDDLFRLLLNGETAPELVAALLTALRLRGETSSQLARLARLTREAMVPFPTGGLQVLDTCGTGGDGSGSFNVSTAAALAAAAAGQPVVKHGNRGFSSASGSADLLDAMGLPCEADATRWQRALAAAAFAFCYAPRHHPALRHAAAVRRKLKSRTLFNLLGPLVNPARPAFQLIGVGQAELVDVMAGALEQLKPARAAVVSAVGGFDEVSASGSTEVRLIEEGRSHSLRWEPADFGLPAPVGQPSQIRTPAESAAAVRSAVTGQNEGDAAWVAVNAGAGLWLAGKVATLRQGYELAWETMRSGAVAKLENRLRFLLTSPAA